MTELIGFAALVATIVVIAVSKAVRLKRTRLRIEQRVCRGLHRALAGESRLPS